MKTTPSFVFQDSQRIKQSNIKYVVLSIHAVTENKKSFFCPSKASATIAQSHKSLRRSLRGSGNWNMAWLFQNGGFPVRRGIFFFFFCCCYRAIHQCAKCQVCSSCGEYFHSLGGGAEPCDHAHLGVKLRLSSGVNFVPSEVSYWAHWRGQIAIPCPGFVLGP